MNEQEQNPQQTEQKLQTPRTSLFCRGRDVQHRFQDYYQSQVSTATTFTNSQFQPISNGPVILT